MMVFKIFSEVRVEGLETLDYFENLNNRTRYTEQADAITFDGEVLISKFNPTLSSCNNMPLYYSQFSHCKLKL